MSEIAASESSATQRKSSEERKEMLARAIHTQVAQGARVESQSDFSAVLVKGHRPNHVLHFFIGLVTLGFWWLVWIVLALVGGEKRMAVTVDEWGNTGVQKL